MSWTGENHIDIYSAPEIVDFNNGAKLKIKPVPFGGFRLHFIVGSLEVFNKTFSDDSAQKVLNSLLCGVKPQ
jgi:hypothetical protein